MIAGRRIRCDRWAPAVDQICVAELGRGDQPNCFQRWGLAPLNLQKPWPRSDLSTHQDAQPNHHAHWSPTDAVHPTERTPSWIGLREFPHRTDTPGLSVAAISPNSCSTGRPAAHVMPA